MPIATMTSKGQITIPKEIRVALGLRPGTRVDFVKEPDGTVALRPLTRRLLDLAGMIRYDGPPVTIEEMNEGIARAVVENDERSRS